MMENSKQPRWTEIELLPEWDEEYYDVYTAKKFGKWVMLKTLKKQYRDLPEYRAMLDREFDVRYNLAHPNIIMINDIEDVDTIGRCIITDDVYGDSLRKLIDSGKVTSHHVDQLRNQLVSALEYVQANHFVHPPLRPERIIFTENVGNLKLIDVGVDRLDHLSPTEASEDIYNYGKVIEEVIERCGIHDATLREVARRCTDPDPRKRYRDVRDLRLALERRTNNRLYIIIISFLVVMVAILGWLLSSGTPAMVN